LTAPPRKNRFFGVWRGLRVWEGPSEHGGSPSILKIDGGVEKNQKQENEIKEGRDKFNSILESLYSDGLLD